MANFVLQRAGDQGSGAESSKKRKKKKIQGM